MIKINDTISFDEGVELNLQNEDFKTWFHENCQPNITFADGKNGSIQTCTNFDEFNRPSTWEVEGLKITAVYFTESVNYDINTFIIN